MNIHVESPRTVEGLTNRIIVKSVLFHLAVILAFTINAYLFPSEGIKFENAIRVDLVGLPEKLKALPPPAKKPEVAKPPAAHAEPAPKETPKTAPARKADKKAELARKKAEEKALAKLQAMEALEEIEAEEKSKANKRSAVAGNAVSAGNALTGIKENQIASYIGQVKEHVHKNFSIPQWMSDARLRAEATVLIDARGVVISRNIVKGSGNSTFDDLVLTAIDQSSPFPPPPGALAGIFRNKGFTLGFPE
jgi:colicin import membrane protein